MNETRLNVGLIGAGTVGAGVAQLLLQEGDRIAESTGVRLTLARAADIDPKKAEACGIPPAVFTRDAAELVRAEGIDVVVELIGGTTTARDLVAEALAAGRHVVTANKALLATCGPELYRTALDAGASLAFEASVAGGIPVVQAVRDGLAANRIQLVMGILNGTANYILTRMSDEGMAYDDALREAQENGYAEKDPSLDVNGTDAAHKLAVLASLAFGAPFRLKDVYVEGITEVTPADIEQAKGMGYAMKLLAIAKDSGNGVELRVHPALIPATHPLAAVSGVFNAVCVTGSAVGDTMFYGRGAGRMPTASAVVGDLIDLALGRAQPAFRRVAERILQAPPAPLRRIGDIRTRHYLRLQALDSPGVLARVARILGDNDISIASMHQQERKQGEAVPVVMMTHAAVESCMQTAVAAIDGLDVIKGRTLCIRVEEP